MYRNTTEEIFIDQLISFEDEGRVTRGWWSWS